MEAIRDMVIERRRLRAEVQRLRAAIQAHREKLSADSLCDFADMELWEVLE